MHGEKNGGRADALGDALTNGLLGAAIAFLCILPPVVHFVSGPLGPAIGGMVAGYRTRATGAVIPVVGLTVGVGMALGVAVLGGVLGALLPMELSGGAVAIFAVVAFLYGTLLGAIGAWAGGWWYRQSRQGSG